MYRLLFLAFALSLPATRVRRHSRVRWDLTMPRLSGRQHRPW